jgi:type II secretory pathway component GspD/PulD (secretin)
MKRKLCILTLVGLVAWSFAAVAQTNPPAGEPAAASAGGPTPTNELAQAQPAPDTAPGTNAPAAGTNAAPTAESATQPAATPAAVPADQASVPQPGAVIPLIVMDDVPLTDAIKNLARQAGLNYMLDPKVAFGQIGPDGRPIPQPTVSIRWENVTAQQALNALLNNYNLQLLEDPKSKIARITVKDPAAPDPLVTKIIQLKYAAPTNIMIAVQNTFIDKRSKVVADIRTSQLVVLATEKEMPGVEDLVEHLDTKTKQVLIEARLLETSINPSTSKGVDWSGTLAAQNISFGNGVMSGTSTTTLGGAGTTSTLPSGRTVNSGGNTVSTVLNSVIGAGGLGATTAGGFNPATFFLNADGLRAVVSFLNKYAEAKVISSPRTVTLDNETAKIEVTRASPIINVTAGTANTTGGSQIQYTNLGVILKVTPRISANNYVNLQVTPEVSRIFDTVTKTIGSSGIFQADEYDIRRIETRVMIPSGHTLVLGGLVQDDVRTGNTKVPVLGDIPVFGYLFRSDTKSRQKSNLLVFLTPTIVQEEDFQPTQSDFLKHPVPTKDSVEGDWSAWDSGKPKDWKASEDVSPDSGKFDETLWKQKDATAPATSGNP